VAVHTDYRGARRGDALLGHMERLAREKGLERLFVLTTQTAHWFLERGYEPNPARPAARAEARVLQLPAATRRCS